jgi:uncharacterized protein
MPRHLAEGIKKLIASRIDDLDCLYVSWFGGEPLLALPTVVDISSFAKDLFSRHGKKFIGAATTNASLLSREVFLRLLHVGVNEFQITLDGPQAIHDITRVRADGSGTFDRIWNNLLDIGRLANDDPSLHFRVTLRIHYDARTAYLLSPLINDIIAHFDYPEHFSVHFHRIERLGGPTDRNILEASEREDQFVDNLMLANLRGHVLPHTLGTQTDGYICYAARANSLVIRADGRIGKCTVALRDDRNTIGQLRPDGSLEIDNDALRPWLRGLFTNDPAELSCPLQGLPWRISHR